MNMQIPSRSLLALLFIAPSLALSSGQNYDSWNHLKPCHRALAGLPSPAKSKRTRGRILIVDPYSSGALIAAKAHALGFTTDAIHSDGRPRDFQSGYRPWDFETSFAAKHYPAEGPSFDIPLSAVLRFMKTRNHQAIIAGAESGAVPADTWGTEAAAQKMRVTHNPINLAIRDKVMQSQIWDDANIPRPEWINAKSAKEAIEWANSRRFITSDGAGNGVYIKSATASGGEQGDAAFTESEIKALFARWLHGKNNYGDTNKTLLVQKFVPDPEYAWNPVVYRDPKSGKFVHLTTDIWKYRKKHGLYLADDLVPFEDSAVAGLEELGGRILRAVGQANNAPGRIGWSHVETRSGHIIEIGGRMMGTSQPALAEMATGVDSVTLGLQAWLEPEKLVGRQSGYPIRRYARVVQVNRPQDGLMLSFDGVIKLTEVPGVVRTVISGIGERGRKASNLHDSSGMIWVLADSVAKLDEIEEQIRHIESHYLFVP